MDFIFEIFGVVLGIIYFLVFFIVFFVIIKKASKAQNKNNTTYFISKKYKEKQNNPISYSKEDRIRIEKELTIREKYNKLKKENKIYLNGEEYNEE